MSARPRGPGLAGLHGCLAGAGWTQARLATRLGVSAPYLSGVARGRYPLPPHWTARICELLGCSFYPLLGLRALPPKGGASLEGTRPIPVDRLRRAA